MSQDAENSDWYSLFPEMSACGRGDDSPVTTSIQLQTVFKPGNTDPSTKIMYNCVNVKKRKILVEKCKNVF